MARTTAKFREWLAGQSPTKLAKEVDVTVGAVYTWRNGLIMPRPEKAWLLVELSKGALTIEDILKPPAVETTQEAT